MDVESLQLGPGSRGPGMFTAWGKGSATRNSQTKEDQGPAVQKNRFAAFSMGAGAGMEAEQSPTAGSPASFEASRRGASR